MPDHDGSGVGLANGFGTMIVSSSVITNNRSESTHNTSGGGIFNLFGNLTISDTTIANNRLLEGNSGAGIQSIHGIVEIFNSEITGNSVGDDSSGAGIDAIKTQVTIDNSVIANNLNPSTSIDDINNHGGGIRINQGGLAVTNSAIYSNTAQSGSGGGIAQISGGRRPIAYTMVDNRFYAGGPTYNFIDISSTGTALGLGNDDSSLQNIGFDFTFYDAVTDTVYVSSNGFLDFPALSDPTSTSFDCSEDNGAPSMAIFAFADDLDPGSGGEIYVQTQGVSPNLQFIVQYEAVPINGETETVSFQVILYEGSNRILVQYKDVEQSIRTGGGSAVMGLDSSVRGDYDSYQALRYLSTCGWEGIPLKNGLAILYEPAGAFLVENTLIHNNSSGDTGGGIYFDGSASGIGGTGDLTNVTIADNSAGTSGGGIFNDSGWPRLTNVLVYSNTAVSNGAQISNTVNATPTIAYSDIQDSGGSSSWDAALGTDGGNNIDAGSPLY